MMATMLIEMMITAVNIIHDNIVKVHTCIIRMSTIIIGLSFYWLSYSYDGLAIEKPSYSYYDFLIIIFNICIIIILIVIHCSVHAYVMMMLPGMSISTTIVRVY